MLHQDMSTGVVSLITHHGIDQDTSNITQPQTQVLMKISGPTSMVVSLADDTASEFKVESPGFIFGNWSFQANSDGGVIGGLPFPGNWQVDVGPSFDQNIKSWQWVDGTGNLFGLTGNGLVSIRSNAGPSAGVCRTDCTMITCGDGRLDAGEQCDDGNPFGGDGCSSSCVVESVILD
jgi:cysteine-rich repeat protein